MGVSTPVRSLLGQPLGHVAVLAEHFVLHMLHVRHAIRGRGHRTTHAGRRALAAVDVPQREPSVSAVGRPDSIEAFRHRSLRPVHAVSVHPDARPVRRDGTDLGHARPPGVQGRLPPRQQPLCVQLHRVRGRNAASRLGHAAAIRPDDFVPVGSTQPDPPWQLGHAGSPKSVGCRFRRVFDRAAARPSRDRSDTDPLLHRQVPTDDEFWQGDGSLSVLPRREPGRRHGVGPRGASRPRHGPRHLADPAHETIFRRPGLSGHGPVELRVLVSKVPLRPTQKVHDHDRPRHGRVQFPGEHHRLRRRGLGHQPTHARPPQGVQAGGSVVRR